MPSLYVASRISGRVPKGTRPKGGMLRKKLRLLAGLTALFAAVIFLGTAVSAVWYAPDTEIPAPDFEKGRVDLVAPSEYPIRVRIPALDIDAAVQEVGVNVKGNMATPSNFTDVGWYKYGTPPGIRGSAVVAGHVDNGLGLAGVFKKLNSIKVGDTIFVEKKDGTEVRFRVAEIQTYPYTDVPRDILFSRSDMPRLNLITCDGAWVRDAKTYDQRLVVYSELVQ